ncbi:MAG: DUF4190 domain-containing protein [Roseburia sp.]|nr:DUF4190 domain-containing protein [Roseburia sp.]
MEYRETPNSNMDQYRSRRSPGMATASLVLGIVSLVSSACIYAAMPCGALGMILALLSRGGTRKMDNQATVGLALSVCGLAFTILFTGFSFLLTYKMYGGWDGIMREYMNLYGVDTLEELYQILGIY